jgi:hypothetical protein
MPIVKLLRSAFFQPKSIPGATPATKTSALLRFASEDCQYIIRTLLA